MDVSDKELVDATMAFFTNPINDHGTPYVSIPLDFTIAEQEPFFALIDQDRFVSREEQIAVLRAVRDARVAKAGG
jgi:hypothetical protein